ncbi:NlpC/P60 family protein [Solihabitans fulvus]|uniref:NlpC/P60 family protein n=1 Tax=Solihabitans fulvus TaxID=1892852 RepID=A0A5B2WJX9_9PSEU|nr:NlpC/P60 family protein [Solihabitans fulvus]KAA2252383.1 NlpC/P60 family protein [Solihabitans fulvus]
MNRTRTLLVAAVGLAYLLGAPLMLIGVAWLADDEGIAAVCTGSSVGPGGAAEQVGDQSWTAEQLANARTITQVTGTRPLLARRAAVIAIAVTIVESGLRNLDHGDRDSLGLFQQRPSQGWGTREQILNPTYATNTFLDHLVHIDHWAQRPLGEVAQEVQRSAFPDRYAPWEHNAGLLVDKYWIGPDNSTGQPPDLGATPVVTPGCLDHGGTSLPLTPGAATLPVGWSPPTDARQRAAVEFALAQLGKPYVWGASGPDSWDCSSLTQAAWAAAGVAISRTTQAQANDGLPVFGPASIQPGDLLFIPGDDGTAASPGHVGLAIGQGLLVHAPQPGQRIQLAQVHAWVSQIVAIRRPT